MTFWTEESVSRLCELWPGELTTAEIGAELGCTKNAVIGKAGRLNLPMRQDGRRYLTPEQKAKSKDRLRQKQRIYNARWREKTTRQTRLRLIAREGRLLEPLNIPFSDLGRGMCRYPTDDAGQFYCGRPQEHGTSYCDDCCRVVLTERGYEAVINRKLDPLRRPMGGYVARPFAIPVMGGLVREVPFG